MRTVWVSVVLSLLAFLVLNLSPCICYDAGHDYSWKVSSELRSAMSSLPDDTHLVYLDLCVTSSSINHPDLSGDAVFDICELGVKIAGTTYSVDGKSLWCLVEVRDAQLSGLVSLPSVVRASLAPNNSWNWWYKSWYKETKIDPILEMAAQRVVRDFPNDTINVVINYAKVPEAGEVGGKQRMIDELLSKVNTLFGQVEKVGMAEYVLAQVPPHALTELADDPRVESLEAVKPVCLRNSLHVKSSTSSLNISTLVFLPLFLICRSPQRSRKIKARLVLLLLLSSFLSWTLSLPVYSLNISRQVIEVPTGGGIEGSGVTIAVIDEGIDITHPDLQDAIVDSVDFTGWNDPQDYVGHGTHVAGIVASRSQVYRGIAPQASLINLKVHSTLQMRDALQWCIDHRTQFDIRVVQMSVGEGNEYPTGDGTDPLSMKADDVVDSGMVSVCAINEFDFNQNGKVELSYPEQAFNVIAVGSVLDKGTASTADDSLAFASARGPTGDGRPKPDVLAPGGQTENPKVGIWSTWSQHGDSRFCEVQDGLYARVSGTSMAAPHVSGTVALMLQCNPNLTPAQVKAILRQTGQIDAWMNGLTVNERGHGTIDASSAITIVMQGPISLDQMYDSWAATTPTHDLPWYCYDYLTFTVKPPSTQGIVMEDIDYHDKWTVIPVVEYRLLKQEYVRDIWIDGVHHDLGSEMTACLLSGPRVLEKGPGYLKLRAIYRIGSCSVSCYWDMTQNGQDFWVEYNGGTSWRTLIFLDPQIWYDTNYAFLGDWGPTVLTESRISDLTYFYVRTLGVQEYLKIAPESSPYTAWLLKHGYAGNNPDEPAALNSEYIYNRDLDVYVETNSQIPAVSVSRMTGPSLPDPNNCQNDANTGDDAGNSFSDATSIDPGSYEGILCNSYPTDTNDFYKFYVDSDYSIKVYMTPPFGNNFDLELYDPDHNLAAESHNGAGISELVGDHDCSAGWWVIRIYISNGEAEHSFIVSVYGTGDVNRDSAVDIYDAIGLARAFNSNPGTQNWNSVADFNCDNSVDIYDALILANNFGNSYGRGSGVGAPDQTRSGGAMVGAGSTILLDPNTMIVFKGEVFSVNVKITGVTDLQGWEFRLYWNSTVLNCTNAAIQTPTEWQDNAQNYKQALDRSYNATHDRFWAAQAANYPAPSFNGSMTVATLTFQALQPGATSLTLAETKLGNSTAQPIDHTVSSSSVTVYYGRYMRSDTKSVNGLNAYLLNATETTSYQDAGNVNSGRNAYWGIRAWIRHANGVEQEIALDGQTGTPKAVVVRGSGSGMLSATTSVNQTTMQTTDSLVVRVYFKTSGSSWVEVATFTTEQLGGTTLTGCSWTVYYYTWAQYYKEGGYTAGHFYWGSPARNSRIQNLQYS